MEWEGRLGVGRRGVWSRLCRGCIFRDYIQITLVSIGLLSEVRCEWGWWWWLLVVGCVVDVRGWVCLSIFFHIDAI